MFRWGTWSLLFSNQYWVYDSISNCLKSVHFIFYDFSLLKLLSLRIRIEQSLCFVLTHFHFITSSSKCSCDWISFPSDRHSLWNFDARPIDCGHVIYSICPNVFILRRSASKLPMMRFANKHWITYFLLCDSTYFGNAISEAHK